MKMFLTLAGTTLFMLCYAGPVLQERSLSPKVTIKNGTVIGSSTGSVESFKGIPFAQPPTGTLRLKPPQSITQSFGTITATGTPTSCPQLFSNVDSSNVPDSVLGMLMDNPLLQRVQTQGEDCLTLNVQRPAGTTASSKLPVLFWIYGGGFELGSTQTYDGTSLVQKSSSLGHKVIYVAVNYRVAGFGFLAGKELQKDGSTNLGLRDQRLGMEWVQENVAAFGGDPTKVTIWGESAGSISVYDQLLIGNSYHGRPLYRAAIMDSGTAVPAVPVSDPKPQAIYDTVVKAAGCSGKSDTLTCLRSLPYQQFLNAANSVDGIFSYNSIDLSYLPRPDPEDDFFPTSPNVATTIAKVPVIIGDQEDEGTLFSLVQSNITNTDQLVTYLKSYFPYTPRSLVAELVATYPNSASAGSPFNTSVANEIYPEFKRLAAILGDITFTLARRSVLADLAREVTAWSYLSSYLYGTPVLGTFHGTDIFEDYYDLPDPIPASTVQTYYISFVNYLDPNMISTAAPLINWPRYSASSPELLNFKALTNGIIPDTFRQTSYNFLRAHSSDFRV
ncbi:MAG: hypothetical protein M1828_001699 [Chrysothrix sp. TS-e1954]|nr:MAG: hypothetical protein M1828_001699 [Chrysothrix sp. TS-e1954]